MRGLFMLFLVLVCVAFLWGGLQGVYVGLTNTSPTVITCDEYARRQPRAAWLQLADCRLDPQKAVRLKTKTGKTEGFYAPLIPEGVASGGTVHILVRSDSLQGLAKVATAETCTGMVLFGIEEDNRVREAFDRSADMNLAKDYVIIDPGEEPALGFSLTMLIIGGLLGLFLYRRFTRSAAAAERTSADRAEQTADELITTATAAGPGTRHGTD